MNTNTRTLRSRCKITLLAASQLFLLAHAAPSQDAKWLDPQIQYFDFGNAPVRIGYRRLAPDRTLMAVGWQIQNTTNQTVEFYLDQTYFCGGRVVQERRNSFVSVQPGQTLSGGRFRGDDIILWDDFFYGTRPGDQLRTGEVIDRVSIRVRWKDNGDAARTAAQRRAAEEREAAERAERAEEQRRERERQAAEQRRERERRDAQRHRDEERRTEAAERSEREAEQRRRDTERRDRVLDAHRDRLRQIQDTTKTLQNGVDQLQRGLQERLRRQAEEREEERRAEAEAEERRERRERRRLGIDD